LPPENAAIIETWQRLADTRALSFTATPGPDSTTGWAGRGHGTVAVQRNHDSIRFLEHGSFALDGGSTPVAFHNVYHWRYMGDRLSLSHERFGSDAPAWLFDLVANDAGGLISDAAHRCGADDYRGRLVLAEQGFSLHWSICGPRKDESLIYHYHCAD